MIEYYKQRSPRPSPDKLINKPDQHNLSLQR